MGKQNKANVNYKFYINYRTHKETFYDMLIIINRANSVSFIRAETERQKLLE